MRITAITTEKATIKIPQQPQQLPQQLLKNVNANRALLGLKVNAYRAVQTNNTTKRKGSASVRREQWSKKPRAVSCVGLINDTKERLNLVYAGTKMSFRTKLETVFLVPKKVFFTKINAIALTTISWTVKESAKNVIKSQRTPSAKGIPRQMPMINEIYLFLTIYLPKGNDWWNLFVSYNLSLKVSK